MKLVRAAAWWVIGNGGVVAFHLGGRPLCTLWVNAWGPVMDALIASARTHARRI
jgi:hypothetical protein